MYVSGVFRKEIQIITSYFENIHTLRKPYPANFLMHYQQNGILIDGTVK